MTAPHLQYSGVRWGLIGCGAVTERKSAPAYALTPRSRLAGVWGRDHARAADYAKRHNVPEIFDDWRALILSPHIDAIYLATPPASHREFARAIAQTRKPCVMEKPLAHDYEDARAIEQAFRCENTPLFVAFYRRALPRFRLVAQWLREGRIGEVKRISWQLTRPIRESDRARQWHWRIDPELAPGGYFDDLACHGLDLFDYWLGPIGSASGIACNRAGLYAPPDCVEAQWQHENGVAGYGLWDFAANERCDRVIITGHLGEMHCAMFDDEPVVLQMASRCETHSIANPDPIQAPLVASIMATLLDHAEPLSTGTSALRTARVMHGILRGVESLSGPH